MILIFYLFVQVIGYYIYKPFTTVQQGPCDTASNMLQIPNNLLGPVYNQFTITGWFKKDSKTSTNKNLLFLVGPDTNNYANFHLAVTLNSQLKVQSCLTIKDCMTLESSDLTNSAIDDQWIFVLVSMNFPNKLIHYKIVCQSDSQSRPYVYSQTQELKTVPTFTNTQGIVIKNKVVSLYSFNGFCGKFKEFSYFGNLYTESRRQSFSFDADFIAYWMTKLPQTTSAINSLSGTQDLGQLIGGVTINTNWGWEFTKNQYAQFIDLRSQFGDKFMISANVYIGNINSEMNFIYRKDQNGNQLLSIKFISSATTFNVKVSIGGIVAETHGQISGQLNKWYPIIFCIYNNYNFYPDATTPGMALFDIITPDFQEYGKKAFKVYSDQLSDQYFFGDYPTTSVWNNGVNKFIYSNIRIFKGYNYAKLDSSNLKGCLLEIGELFPVCIACNKYSNSGATDNYQMCYEAGTYNIPNTMTSTNLITCPQGQSYYNSQCQIINIDRCIRGSDINTCTKCEVGSTLSSNSCSIQTFTTHCLTGTYECISKYNGDYTSYLPLIQSLNCEQKYYLDVLNQQCLSCESSCKTCIEVTKCISCPTNQYLLKATSLCNSNCDTIYKDTDQMICVDNCTSNQLITDDLKYCSVKCPNTYKQLGQNCVTSCPTKTFNENGICRSCDNKCYECTGSSNKQCTKCNYKYFLLTTICEDFCADKSKYANELTNSCTNTCDSPGVIYGMKCLYYCPDGYVEDNNRICQLQCPIGYISTIQLYSYTLIYTLEAKTQNAKKCQQCAVGCETCDDIDKSPVSKNCLTCLINNFLIDKNCETTCPLTLPLEDSYNQRCLLSCPPQFYKYTNKCVLKCPTNFYSYDQECKSICPDGTYPEITNNSCLLCAYECETCNEGGPSNCLTCKGGYYKYDTICVQICPSDRKYHNTVTFVCESTCPNYYLDDGKTFECYDQCPINYNIDGQRCTYYCSVGKYLDIDTCKTCNIKCARCDDGTNTSCTKCSNGYYLDGKTCSETCDENPTYYRSDYGYVCVEKCPGTLLMVDSLKKCVASCPNTHVKLLDHCLLECPIGYYTDVNLKCQLCPQECTQCTSDISCQKCATKYFQQDDKCLRTCLNGYFQNLETYLCQQTCDKLINNDGLNNLQCLDKCPDVKVEHNKQCIYECPDGYYKNTELKICSLCSIECKTCTGSTNEDCIECQNGFQQKDDYCVGVCPTGQFLNYVSCESCAFRCLNCIDTKYNCQTCRGNRKGAPQCLCDKGYFDDRKNSDCQKCQLPCVTCQSLTFCLTCNYNLEPPDCICKRPPPVQSNYCITCKLSFAESVRFNNDFSQIIIIFTYPLITNSENAFYFSKENCQQWFSNENLGESPICQQNGNKFIIQLGNNPTIMPNDNIQFKNNTFIDNSLQLCQNTYIEQINNTQLILSAAIIPNIVLSYPDSYITNCVDINIETIKEINNGGRSLIFYSWNTTSTDEGLIFILDQYSSSSYLTIPAKTLKPDQNYSISVTYGNFLGYNKTTTITIMTTSKNPSLITTFDSSKTYYANFELTIPYKLYSYTCDSDNIQEITQSYPVNLNIKSISTGTSQHTEDIASDSGMDKSFTVPESKLKANTDYTIEISVGEIKITKSLKFGNNQLFAEFLTTDRIVGNKTFKLQVNASDSDVPLNQSKIGLSYQWTCMNLYFNIPCRTTLNKPLTFTNNDTVNVSSLPAGYVYLFKCTITKESRTISLTQQIIVSDLNMTEQIFSTDISNKETLVVTDNLLYNLDVNEYYLVIIRYYAILKIEYIQKSVLRLNLYFYLSKFGNQQEISIIIGGTLVRYNLRVKPALQLSSFVVAPYQGYSLETNFTFTINDGIKNESDSTQYQIYVYKDYDDLKWDLGNFSNTNGYLLFDWSQEKSITTLLPSCQHILVKLNKEDQFGMVYLNISVTKSKTAVSIKNNIEFMTTFIDFNSTDLFLDKLIIMELYFLESNKCNYNCWNRGECVNEVCICDYEYMTFSDCSGILNDQDVWDTLASKLYTDFNSAEQTITIANSIALLLQLSQFTNIIQLTSIDKLSNQIDSFLQPQNVDTGIISQSLESADYKSAFNILNFMSSLNKQLFTNDSNVVEMKSINEKLFESVNKLVLYASDILLDGEKQIYQSTSLLLSIEKKIAKGRRLLAENKNLLVDNYYETNILRLQNNFPYPNHTQELYYSTAEQIRTYKIIKKARPLQNLYGFIQETTNYVCILSSDGKTFDDIGCDTSSQDLPIVCTCQPGYVTLVDDSSYYYKPFYFEINFVLEKLYIAIAYGGFFVLIIILLIVGHIKDSRDLDSIKPILPGLKNVKPPQKVKSLRKIRKNQVFPYESELFSPAIDSDKQQSEEIQEIGAKQSFVSKAQLSNCLKMNTLFGSILLFKKNIGRKLRLILLLGRVSLSTGILGFIVNMQIVQLYQIILFVIGLGFIFRILNVICKYLNQKSSKRKECIYMFVGYLLTTLFLFSGILLMIVIYFTIYDRLVIYWGISLVCVFAVELFVTDFILQIFQLLYDYYRYKKQIDEDDDDMEEDEQAYKKQHKLGDYDSQSKLE